MREGGAAQHGLPAGTVRQWTWVTVTHQAVLLYLYYCIYTLVRLKRRWVRWEGPSVGARQTPLHPLPARLSAAPRTIAARWGEGSGAPPGHRPEGELWEPVRRLAFGLSTPLGCR